MKKEKKVLIVGSGLSGICVGIHSINSGHKVTLIDNLENKSSIIAAGQINPMVFRRMTKSWRLDDFLPFAENFYNDLTSKTTIPIYHPITIRRMFSSDHEKVMWLEKQNTERFEKYLETITEEDDNYSFAQNDFGSGRIKGSSYVDPIPFLIAGKKWIKDNGQLIEEYANYSDFNPELGTYKDELFDEIIFCEGSNNNLNPWFGYLPVEHTKGEVLTIESDQINENESLNRKCFLLPIGKKHFRLGATYEWNTNNTELTEEGKADLLEKVQLLTKFPFEIIEHKAGIRPTSPDRRPIIGRHSEFSKLSIFNGLGTKGYLIAPKLSEEFVQFLDGEAELDKEVKLERYNKLLIQP